MFTKQKANKSVKSLGIEAAKKVILGQFENDNAAHKGTPGLNNNNQVRHYRLKMEESGAAGVLREAHLAEGFIQSSPDHATKRAPGRIAGSKNKPKPGAAHLHGASSWEAFSHAHKEMTSAVANKEMTAAEASRRLAAQGITLGPNWQRRSQITQRQLSKSHLLN